jgi:5-methyltetrahydrofolate--homocysteine methyltransferase
MASFLETLRSGRVLLMDGAMGTELQRAGIQEGECYELWNLTHPDKVRAIHRAYVDAGADVLLTNTFQANPIALGKHGLGDRIELIISQAITLARSVATPGRFVLVSFGPFTLQRVRKAALEVVARMLVAAREADGWLFETSSDAVNLHAAMKCCARRWVPEIRPFLISWTYMRTPAGTIQTINRRTPFLLARRENRLPLGVNCGRDISMNEIIPIIRRYRQATDLPLFARPNAGTPARVGDCWVYPLTPEMMAARLPELLEAGVSMVGGCCGTTPEHIAAMRPIIDAWNAKRQVRETSP